MLGYHQYFSRRWPFPLSPTAAPRALWRLGADPHWRALYPCPGRSTSDCEHARRRTAAKGLAIAPRRSGDERGRSEEHTSELQSLMRISYAVLCLKKKKKSTEMTRNTHTLQRTNT